MECHKACLSNDSTIKFKLHSTAPTLNTIRLFSLSLECYHLRLVQKFNCVLHLRCTWIFKLHSTAPTLNTIDFFSLSLECYHLCLVQKFNLVEVSANCLIFEHCFERMSDIWWYFLSSFLSGCSQWSI
jgi:hypothetical protein